MTLILGSQSPRRREILSFFKLPFTTASPPFDEEKVIFKGDPAAFATEIAIGKARALQPEFPHETILTADTVVYCEGKVYGKPSSEEESIEFLKAMAGKWQSVFTAITLKTPTEEFSGCEESRVEFKDVTNEELRKYCKMFPAKIEQVPGAFRCLERSSLVASKGVTTISWAYRSILSAYCCERSISTSGITSTRLKDF